MACGKHCSQHFLAGDTIPYDSPDLRLSFSYLVWCNICPRQKCPRYRLNYTVTFILHMQQPNGEKSYHHSHLQMRQLRHWEGKGLTQSPLTMEAPNPGNELQSLRSGLSILNFPRRWENVPMGGKCKKKMSPLPPIRVRDPRATPQHHHPGRHLAFICLGSTKSPALCQETYIPVLHTENMWPKEVWSGLHGSNRGSNSRVCVLRCSAFVASGSKRRLPPSPVPLSAVGPAWAEACHHPPSGRWPRS